MKKNKNKKRLGVIAMMLLLILAVGATAGTTLAKYISSVTKPTQQATVAKWGYTVTASANDLFGQKYDNSGKIIPSTDNNTTAVVASSRNKNVVAPGTKGSLDITISGSAEVNAVLKVDLDIVKTVVLTDDEEYAYRPINWTLTAGSLSTSTTDLENFKQSGQNTTTKAGLSEVVARGLETMGNSLSVTWDDDSAYVYLPAGTTISNFKMTIAWEWAFGNEGYVDEFVTSDADAQDTILGIIADNTNKAYSQLPANIIKWLGDNYSQYGEYEDGQEFYEALTAQLDVEVSLGAAVAQTMKTATEWKAAFAG
ncbi:MAG: hypothetical protein J1F36_03720 [Clostridiales bacterium]|nr:hypothetical protein [Clostridiales bacterium]